MQVPSLEGSWETLPRFPFLVGRSAWPFRACRSLKNKTKRRPNLFPILWKELCNQVCLPAQLRGRTESAPPPPFPSAVALCPPLPPLPHGPWGHRGPVLKAPMGVSPEQHARAGGVRPLRHTGGLLGGAAALLPQHQAPRPGGTSLPRPAGLPEGGGQSGQKCHVFPARE